MVRAFVPFDRRTIDRELDDLLRASAKDAAKLDFCVLRYQNVGFGENPSPAAIKQFKEGFLKLRHASGEYKGRLLFYVPNQPRGTSDLVILTVFRKETQKTPKEIVARAVQRMSKDRDQRSKKDTS